eukprot:TRINITY_DN34690_c0_g1_i1.p1 TRINITY_DN34690_c0_g1~~TRINITY_DN34690_c0_g1_i1.p1  ORF type:complete len:261 (+),score=32.40 TRINITY_DN34690_c0_g1_i1:63-785(+)
MIVRFGLITLSFSLVQQCLCKVITTDSWETDAPGKTLFIMFYAPWCQHCKTLKPVWDELEKKTVKEDVLVGSVDCTNPDSKDLCTHHSIDGYPIIKYGHRLNMQTYKGAKEKKALKKLISEQTKKRKCGPKVKDRKLCSSSIQELIGTYLQKRPDELDKDIEDLDGHWNGMMADWRQFVGELNDLRTRNPEQAEEHDKEYKRRAAEMDSEWERIKDKLFWAKEVRAYVDDRRRFKWYDEL